MVYDNKEIQFILDGKVEKRGEMSLNDIKVLLFLGDKVEKRVEIMEEKFKFSITI